MIDKRIVHRQPRRARTGHQFRGRGGQALLEFAFLLPVLVLIILGLVDFGLLFMRYQAITDTAREGTRMAVIVDEASTPEERADAIVLALRNSLNRYGMDGSGAELVGDPNTPCSGYTAPSGTPSQIQISGCGWSGGRAAPARVVIRVPNEMLLLGSFAGLFGDSHVIMLSSAATMRNE